MNNPFIYGEIAPGDAFADKRIDILHSCPKQCLQYPACQFHHTIGVVRNGVVDDIFAPPVPPGDDTFGGQPPIRDLALGHDHRD